MALGSPGGSVRLCQLGPSPESGTQLSSVGAVHCISPSAPNKLLAAAAGLGSMRGTGGPEQGMKEEEVQGEETARQRPHVRVHLMPEVGGCVLPIWQMRN